MSCAVGCHQTQPDVEEAVRGPGALPEGRLPEGVRPTAYRLSLEVVPERDAFSGSALITIELDEAASGIWMHGEQLEVSSIYATHATARIEASWAQKTDDGVVRVDFREPLPAGRSTLHIEYTASFNTSLRGLYRVETGGHAYAFTQFEAISARLAFPCFDEPRFKTPFEVTLTVPDGQFAAANTPVDRAISLPNGLQRITFLPTTPLPTYLVALAVGPFDVVDGESIPPNEIRTDSIPLRGLAAKGKGIRLRYALEHTARFVDVLERYFGIPYPYRKLDLVAVPDFAAGAMENVGLITFREWLLLLDSERATEGQRRAFAYVMAHELAHQWFGNLVTMPWWNDIWLNEAFATWMGNKVVHELHPEFRSDLASLASAERAMGLDSLASARSIRQPILSNHDIQNAFDAITYEKGGGVLSMFEHWMGADVFRDGIRLYLREHENGTATSADLLEALDQVSELDVAAPFLTFLMQPGVPLVTTSMGERSCREGDTSTLELQQERYLPVGSKGDANVSWQIPLCVRHETGTTCGLLDEREGSLDVPGCPRWWMPNEEGAGYFRFAMPPDAWKKLRTAGFSRLSDGGKIATADSLIASFEAGRIEASPLLPWFRTFAANPLRQVATRPMSTLRFMMNDAASEMVRPRVRSYSGRLYRKRFQALGWREKARDSSDSKLLRESVLRFMVMDVRDKRSRSRAARLGRTYVGYRTEAQPTSVPPQLVGLTLAAAVQEEDAAFFDFLLDRFETSEDATVRGRVLAALGNAEDPALSERALDLALDERLRVNEISRVLGAQFRNPRTRARAWTWLQVHFDEVAKRLGRNRAGSLPWYTMGFCSSEDAAEVEAFFEPRVAAWAGGPRNLDLAVESISICAATVEEQRAGIDRAFAR
jgi:alanyl aminopeptidase